MKGLGRDAVADQCMEMKALKALVELCHLHGLAVILDVVCNHAGGDFGDQSLYFFERVFTADAACVQPFSGAYATSQ
ncbi:MAG: alpha-amylase family glycosyl hydrolase [Nitrospirota bacterium]|nr:alpha-amylase family glycosyl hydrolase [Nitrospirota bacterium]